MEKLLKLYSKLQAEKQSLFLSLGHDKVWCLIIYHEASKHTIFYSQHTDLDFLGSQAYVALYNWFVNKFGYIP